MSSRTLRRRLAKENTTFQALLDDLRRITAIHQLESDPCCADALASMLGFGDARSFRRAFKRWTGMTPSGYRALRAAHPVSTPPPGEHLEVATVVAAPTGDATAA
jgi:AraC-like DNA-binding protein